MTTSASRGGSFLRFRTGTTGASGRHVAYITREHAAADDVSDVPSAVEIDEAVLEVRGMLDQLRSRIA